MSQTNFDKYLAEQLKNPEFAKRFKKADEAWDIALQLADLRQQAGLSQAQLARKLKTSQQQISRLESANYEGHSLSMLRRVAEALNARVVVSLESLAHSSQLNEPKGLYTPKSGAPKKRKAIPAGKRARKTTRLTGSKNKKKAAAKN